jgi:hypothetical protein
MADACARISFVHCMQAVAGVQPSSRSLDS